MVGPTRPGVFVFTDIEGSTPLWEHEPQAMGHALREHDHRLRAAVERHHGTVCKSMGDGLMARFDHVRDAIEAMVEGQRSLDGLDVGGMGSIRVRMGAHIGEGEERDGDFFGADINTTARLADAGHGGQVLVSAAALAACPALPDGYDTQPLGAHHLKGVVDAVDIHQIVAPGLADQHPPLRTGGMPGNLPQIASGLVGRATEVDELTRLCAERSVVTLRGPGGVGKTRLALNVARAVADKLSLTAWFVDLTTVDQDRDVVFAVANLLGVSRAGDADLVTTIANQLNARSSLLVLDNCEHVLDGATELVDTLTAAGGSLRILATSRQALEVADEQQFEVGPLQTDGDDAGAVPAVELFLTRAHEVAPGLGFSDDELTRVAELCARLDGLPLAIELAAARVDAFGIDDLLAQLERRLSLRARRPDRAAHRTLRDTFDWSYRLLDEEHQRLFAGLGVFAGSFEIADVAHVAADPDADTFDVADLVADLMRRSLVVRLPGTHPTRFELLETARDYALDQLRDAGELDHRRRRHAEHFAAIMQQVAAGLISAEARAVMERGIRAYADCRAALVWAIDNDPDLARRIALAMPEFWKVTDMNEEALALLAKVTDISGDHPAERAELESYWANFEFMIGNFLDAATHAEASIAASHEAGLRRVGRAVARLAISKVFAGDAEAGAALALDELAYWRQRPHEFAACETIPVLHATLSFANAEPDDGIDPVEESIRLAEPFGPLRLGPALHNAAISMLHRDPDRALELLRRDRELETSPPHSWSASSSVMMIIVTLVRLGRFPEARREAVAAMRLLYQSRDSVRTCSTLEMIAFTFADEEPELAAKIFAGTTLERRRVATPGTPEEQERNQRTLDKLRHVLGDDRLRSIQTTMETTPLGEVVDLAERAVELG